MGALLLMLTMATAPQGLVIRLAPLELRGAATQLEADLVTNAIEREWRSQGYEVVTQGSAQAMLAGRLEKNEQGWVLHVTLVDAKREVELDDVKLSVARREALGSSGTEAAKSLASTLRQTFGVRAKVKL